MFMDKHAEPRNESNIDSLSIGTLCPSAGKRKMPDIDTLRICNDREILA